MTTQTQTTDRPNPEVDAVEMTIGNVEQMAMAVLNGIGQYKDWNRTKLAAVETRMEAVEQGKTEQDAEAIAKAVAELAAYLESQVEAAAATLERTVNKRVEEVAPREHFITIKAPGKDDKTAGIEGKPHHQLQKVLDVLAMGEIPYLVGPAGCGKTVLAKQAAELLEVEYAGISCSGGLTEAKFFGRSTPNIQTGAEHYTRTAYVKAYEDGGFFLLDEFDASDDNVMCSLNQSLDNGEMAVPERKDNPRALRHERSYITCTANTYGTGADRQYVSRNQMDAATMDRFTIIEIDYDADIEDQVCPDEKLRATFRKYRDAIMANGLERIVSYRTLRKAYKQKQIGWTMEEIDRAYFAGWHRDEVVMVRGSALDN